MTRTTKGTETCPMCGSEFQWRVPEDLDHALLCPHCQVEMELAAKRADEPPYFIEPEDDAPVNWAELRKSGEFNSEPKMKPTYSDWHEEEPEEGDGDGDPEYHAPVDRDPNRYSYYREP